MIPKDKLQHMAMGVGVCIVVLMMYYLSLGFAMFACCFIFGVFYEVQQWYRKEGTPDVWDAVATTLPGLAAFILLELYPWTR